MRNARKRSNRASLASSAEAIQERSHRIRLTDAEARNIAGDVLGGVDPTTLRQTERSEREAALVRLKDAGLSVRQIQRITGLSLGTISNAGR